MYNCDEVAFCARGVEESREVVGVSQALLVASLFTYRPWHLPVLIATEGWPYPDYKGRAPRPQAGGLYMRRYGLLDADKTARRSEKIRAGV